MIYITTHFRPHRSITKQDIRGFGAYSKHALYHPWYPGVEIHPCISKHALYHPWYNKYMGIKSFIPNRISNRAVIRFLDALSRCGRRLHVAWRASDGHAVANDAVIRNTIMDVRHEDADADGNYFLEEQKAYSGIAFGRTDMSYAGCEVIAVFNALRALGGRPDLGGLIRRFEKDGMVLSGRFGTSPMAIADFFSRKGYEVSHTFLPKEFDGIAGESEVCILTIYNDSRSIFCQIHTICITREMDGYVGHNLYGDGRPSGAYSSVSDMISAVGAGYAKGIMLIGIRYKEKNHTNRNT